METRSQIAARMAELKDTAAEIPENQPPPPAENPAAGAGVLDLPPPPPPAPAKKDPPPEPEKLRKKRAPRKPPAPVDPQAEEGKKRAKKKTITIQSQLEQIMDRMERQSARTDELYYMMRPSPLPTPARPLHQEKVVDDISVFSTRSTRRHPVQGSHVKKRSPKSGPSRTYALSRAGSRDDSPTVSGSSTQSDSDVEAQIKQAKTLLEPRFDRYKGKCDKKDYKPTAYHPFSYLDRERQRDITKNGHPEELSFNEHLLGLCNMAVERAREGSDVHGILTHVIQILEDSGYISWPCIRIFSNTVISNIGRTRWHWDSDRSIEKCRNNI